jgi:glycine cleavage system pyridoxal-binding protein P
LSLYVELFLALMVKESFPFALNHFFIEVFGMIDPVQAIFAKAKAKGALSIICANPLVYGLFTSAADLGADIIIDTGLEVQITAALA